ncbi:MAG: hypothetical protein EPN43_02205 [Jatrophihabitans sp.]|nr:MAG: hypothetical protein EPN43_02205 [Jatrophihabitans sp.]
MSAATVTGFFRPTWCTADGPSPTMCDDHGHCISEPDLVVHGTIGGTFPTERGTQVHREVRVTVHREIGPYPTEDMPPGDTHSVYLAVADTGWDDGGVGYLYLTVAQVEQVRDALTEALRMAAEDRAALLGGAK